MRPKRSFQAPTLFALLLLLLPGDALAESWCAYPLRVHEWGVQVFGESAARPAPLDYAHTEGPKPNTAPTPVRSLPIDGGERELPVISIFAPTLFSDPVPLGLEIGFAKGEASLWFPQVDKLRSAAEANSTEADQARLELLQARAERDPFSANPPLGDDPTRQLVWDRLSLSQQGQATESSTQEWVAALRAIEGALWFESEGESERFVFYEGRTAEQPLLKVERGEEWSEERAHYRLVNDSFWPVHDVLVVRRQGDLAWVFYAPSIPAGKSAGFVLDESLKVDSKAFVEATRGQLERSLTDAESPEVPTSYKWDYDQCVMGRDPAIPVEEATGHRLYALETKVLLDAWEDAFFGQQGTVVIYREDPSYLDAMMPISLYTDMYHYVELRRLSLVLWTEAEW